jgi:predicted ATPase
MLHELCTGDNPFRRDDAAGVIDAHLKLEPPRVTDLNSEVSAYFSECVAALLAKQPGDRFESADSLRSILEQGEKSAWWTELAPRLRRRVEHLPKIRVRREAKLHGRAGDLRLLSEAWERAKSGDGNTVFVEGEAGIGKTRLVDAFLQGLEDKEIHVLYGSYPPSGGLGGMSQAVLGKFGEAGLAEALVPYLTVTPSLVPAFAAVLKHESPPTGSEPLGGEALQAVCVHLMRALAEERPLIWILDDLHFAPRESRDVVLALARAAEGYRTLVVATARPGVPDEELAHFSRLENFQRLKLARLGGREIIELLEDAFKSEALAEKLGVKITKKSDGVPFFIFEMIRGLKEGQFIRQQPDGSYVQTQVIDEIEVPSAVKDLIEGRLRGLPEDQRAVLDAGAVMGMSFDPELVAAVLGENEIRVLRALAEVERRHGLVRDEGDAVRFDQNQIQEVIYRYLPPHLRAKYHAVLAEAYAARLDGEPRGEDYVFLASHHLRGNCPNHGLPHLTPALEQLTDSHRSDAALELMSRALNVPKLLEGKARVEVLLKKSGCHDVRGEREAEREASDEALALADESGDTGLRAKAQGRLALLLLRTSDYAGACKCLEQAVALARAAGDRKVEARASGGLGIVFTNLGRYAEARAQHESHLAFSREIGDRRGETMARTNLGNVLRLQGHVEGAFAQYETSLALARERGDQNAEAAASVNVGNAHLEQGRIAKAVAAYERALLLARGCGNRLWEATATANLGNCFMVQGRYGDGYASVERALALSREIGDRQGQVRAMIGLGAIGGRLGRLGKARANGENALALSREIGDRLLEGYALVSVATAAENEGDVGSALRLGGESLHLLRKLEQKWLVARVLVEVARLMWAKGESGAAVAHVEEALKLAREVGYPDAIVPAAALRARMPGGDLGAVSDALAEYEDRMDIWAKMTARLHLWELIGDKTHLEEAKRLLDFAVEHSPEDCRTSMIENVPLHRDIMKAWEEHGASEE